MSSNEIFPVPASWKGRAWIDEAGYRREYERSVRDPEGFWAAHAARLDWQRKPSKVRDVWYGPDDVHIRWFEDGVLNAAENCLDRHLPARAERPAILWEGDDPADSRTHQLCRAARRSVPAGERPPVARRAQGRPGHASTCRWCPRWQRRCSRARGSARSIRSCSPGFRRNRSRGRILDCDSRILITADEGLRGGRRVPLKANADEALKTLPERLDLHRPAAHRREDRLGAGPGRLVPRAPADQPAQCAPEPMGAEDPLFILYTSGSTGKPKGVLHTTGGYLLAVSLTHQYVLDYHDGDVFWCTADVGWVTGHSYIVYGPLANGATTVMFEGVPTYPDASRFWQIIDKHRVSIFYTAPTAIRALIREGEAPVKKTSRKSLRLLGSVGEPINPEAWHWYHNVVGERRCPIVDTWWQTETGAILIAPLPGAIATKPGSATLPFFGVQPVIVDEQGRVLEGECEGRLCLRDGGPGMMRTVYRRPRRGSCRPTSRLPRPLLHRRRRAARQGRLLLDHRPRRRRDQRLGPSARHGRGRERAGRPSQGGRSGGRGLPARGQGSGHLRLRHAEVGRAAERRAAQRARQWVRKEIGADRRRPTRSSGRPACPRPARARSCDGSCARSPRTTTRTWATPRRSPIPRSSRG